MRAERQGRGGGALAGGNAFVGVAVCASRPSPELPAYGLVTAWELRHLPLGAPATLLRPPQGF